MMVSNEVLATTEVIFDSSPVRNLERHQGAPLAVKDM
jgi:hypothetical protein